MHHVAMVVGQSHKVILRGYANFTGEGDRGPVPIDGTPVSWASDNEAVATITVEWPHFVDVRACGPGRCKILATVGGVLVGGAITVTARPVDEYVIEPVPMIPPGF